MPDAAAHQPLLGSGIASALPKLPPPPASLGPTTYPIGATLDVYLVFSAPPLQYSWHLKGFCRRSYALLFDQQEAKLFLLIGVLAAILPK